MPEDLFADLIRRNYELQKHGGIVPVGPEVVARPPASQPFLGEKLTGSSLAGGITPDRPAPVEIGSTLAGESQRSFLSQSGLDVDSLVASGVDVFNDEAVVNHYFQKGLDEREGLGRWTKTKAAWRKASDSERKDAAAQAAFLADPGNVAKRALHMSRLGATNYLTMQEHGMDPTQNLSLEEYKKIAEEEGSSGSDYFYRFIEKAPFGGAAFEAERMFTVVGSMKALEAGYATEWDKYRLAKFLTEEERRNDGKFFGVRIPIAGEIGEKAINVATAMPAYYVELASAGIVGPVGPALATMRVAAKKATTKTITSLVNNAASRIVEREMRQEMLASVLKKVSARSISNAVTSTGRLLAKSAAKPWHPAMMPALSRNWAAQLYDNYEVTPDDAGKLEVILKENADSIAMGFFKAYGDTGIEIFSEGTGRAITLLRKSVSRGIINPKIAKTIASMTGAERALAASKALMGRAIGSGRWKPAQIISTVTQKGYDGLIAEMLEERIGDMARVVTGVSDGKILEAMWPGWEQLTVEGLGFLLYGQGMARTYHGYHDIIGSDKSIARKEAKQAREQAQKQHKLDTLAALAHIDKHGDYHGLSELDVLNAADQMWDSLESGEAMKGWGKNWNVHSVEKDDIDSGPWEPIDHTEDQGKAMILALTMGNQDPDGVYGIYKFKANGKDVYGISRADRQQLQNKAFQDLPRQIALPGARAFQSGERAKKNQETFEKAARKEEERLAEEATARREAAERAADEAEAVASMAAEEGLAAEGEAAEATQGAEAAEETLQETTETRQAAEELEAETERKARQAAADEAPDVKEEGKASARASKIARESRTVEFKAEQAAESAAETAEAAAERAQATEEIAFKTAAESARRRTAAEKAAEAEAYAKQATEEAKAEVAQILLADKNIQREMRSAAAAVLMAEATGGEAYVATGDEFAVESRAGITIVEAADSRELLGQTASINRNSLIAGMMKEGYKAEDLTDMPMEDLTSLAESAGLSARGIASKVAPKVSQIRVDDRLIADPSFNSVIGHELVHAAVFNGVIPVDQMIPLIEEMRADMKGIDLSKVPSDRSNQVAVEEELAYLIELDIANGGTSMGASLMGKLFSAMSTDTNSAHFLKRSVIRASKIVQSAKPRTEGKKEKPTAREAKQAQLHTIDGLNVVFLNKIDELAHLYSKGGADAKEAINSFVAITGVKERQAKSSLESASRSVKSAVRAAVGKAKKSGRKGTVQIGVSHQPFAREIEEAFAPSGGRTATDEPKASIGLYEPSRSAQQVHRAYSAGKNVMLPGGFLEINTTRAKEIADAYEEAPNQPSKPAVLKSYTALGEEVLDQLNAVIDSGIELEPYTGNGEPYPTAKEMIADIESGHMYYLATTDDTFATSDPDQNNVLLQPTGLELAGRPVLYNDAFRIVHDYFGHAVMGNGFGPRGEETAWAVHAAMFSADARPAMTAETRGQNSWVNFGKHMRRADGSVPERTDPDFVPLNKREFADQKNTILPAWASKGYTDVDGREVEFGQSKLSLAPELVSYGAEGGTGFESKWRTKLREITGLDFVVRPPEAVSQWSNDWKSLRHYVSEVVSSPARRKLWNDARIGVARSMRMGKILENPQTKDSVFLSALIWNSRATKEHVFDHQKIQDVDQTMQDLVDAGEYEQARASGDAVASFWLAKGKDGVPHLQWLRGEYAKGTSGRDIRTGMVERAPDADLVALSTFLLTAGKPDVMILDRVQTQSLWDSDSNIYDPAMEGQWLDTQVNGKTGDFMARSIEEALQSSIERAYGAQKKLLQIDNAAAAGHFHWFNWLSSAATQKKDLALSAMRGESEIPTTLGYGASKVDGQYHMVIPGTGKRVDFTPAQWIDFRTEVLAGGKVTPSRMLTISEKHGKSVEIGEPAPIDPSVADKVTRGLSRSNFVDHINRDKNWHAISGQVWDYENKVLIEDNHDTLVSLLQQGGYDFISDQKGQYGVEESSVFVADLPRAEAMSIANRLNQDSILAPEGYIYTKENGNHPVGTIAPRVGEIEIIPESQGLNYSHTTFADGSTARWHAPIDFDNIEGGRASFGIAPLAEADATARASIGRKRFHGTKKQLPSILDEESYSSLNIYGQGFYTTDSYSVAQGYSKSRKKEGADSAIYEITENAPVSFLDMDNTPASKISSLVPNDNIEDAISYLGDGATVAELYDELRTLPEPADNIQEIFDIIRIALEGEGYGGLKHTGGKFTKGEPHEVKIYFKPREQISYTLVTDPPSGKASFGISPIDTSPTEPGARVSLSRDPDAITPEEIEEVISEDQEGIGRGQTSEDVETERMQQAIDESQGRGDETKEDATLRDQAQALLDDPAAMAEVVDRAERGDSLSDYEQLALQKFSVRSTAEAIRTKDKEAIKRAVKLRRAYTKAGTEAGRALRARRMLFTEGEFNVDQVLDYLLKPIGGLKRDIDKKKEQIDNARTDQEREKLEDELLKLEEKNIKALDSILKRMEKQGINLENLTPEDMAHPETALRIAKIAQQEKAGKMDIVMEAWYNSILSAIPTHGANLVGNTFNAAWELGPQRLLEATINALIPGKKDNKLQAAAFSDFKYILKNLFNPASHRGAFQMGWTAAKTDHRQFEIEHGIEGVNVHEDRGVAIKGKVGEFIRLPMKLLTFSDEYAKQFIGQGLVGTYAEKAGKRKGLEGQELADFIQKEMETPYSDSWVQAAYESKSIVFQEKMTGMLGSAQSALIKFRKDHPWAGFFVPFVQTPMNIFVKGIRKSPIALPVFGLRSMVTMVDKAGIMKDSSMSYKSREKMIKDAANAIFGAGVIMLIYSLILPDEEDGIPRITGSTDWKDQIGRRIAPQYSIRIGNTWYSYARIEPFATTLGLIVDGVSKYHEDGDIGKSSLFAGTSILRQMEDKTFVSGISDLVSLVDSGMGADSDEARVKAFVNTGTKILAGFSPNLIKSTLRAATDAPAVETRVHGDFSTKTFWGRFAPALGEKLVPGVPIPGINNKTLKRDVYGRPMKYSPDMFVEGQYKSLGDIAWQIVSPVRVQRVNDDDKLTDFDVGLYKWNRNNPDKPLYFNPPMVTFRRGDHHYRIEDAGLYDQYLARSGELYKDYLLNRSNIDATKDLSERQVAKMDDLRKRAARKARSELFKDLDRLMKERKLSITRGSQSTFETE